MTFRVPLALAAIAACASVAAARQAPTFSGTTNTVPVYATVTDKYGRLVPDLARDEFAVFDNGKPQSLTSFKHEAQPITIVILVDRSGSVIWTNDLIGAAVDEFVKNLLPADKARLGGFSRRIDIAPQEFTNDHDALHEAFADGRQDAGPTPLWNAAATAIEALASQEGRRGLLILSDSKDSPDPSDTKITLAAVTARAQSDDIAVYAVGLTGQVGKGTMAPPLFQGRGGRGGGGRGGGRGGAGGGSPMGGPEPWMTSTPDPGLKKLAADSGGEYLELAPMGDVATTFARIADELHHPYELAFSAPALDQKMHTLKVTVRQADATARTRSAYLAASGK